MDDTLSFAELDAQTVELLPARTTMMIFLTGHGGSGGKGTGGTAINEHNSSVSAALANALQPVLQSRLSAI